MKILLKFNALILLFFCLTACDKNRLFEENTILPEHGWYYNNKLEFKVPVNEVNKKYNLYINTRINNNFKYSNLFFMLYQINPDKTEQSERHEITIADQTGKWLGNGTGNILSYSQPVKQNITFKEPGIYKFILEQNMRDDTLLHIISAGIRIEYAP